MTLPFVSAGGTSLLKNLDDRLREETGVPVNLAEDPLTAVVLGAGRVLDESLEELKKVANSIVITRGGKGAWAWDGDSVLPR